MVVAVRNFKTLYDTIRQGDDPLLMARVTDEDFDVFVQADITSIGYTIYDVTDPNAETEVETGTLTKSQVWYDTLQTDDKWVGKYDASGFNFAARLGRAKYIPAVSGDATFKIEIWGVLAADASQFTIGWWQLDSLDSVRQ